MVEFLNEPFGDLHRPNIDVGLNGDIHLRTGGCLRDARFEFWFMVELLNEPFGDLLRPDIDIGLHGHIHLRTGGLEVPRQSGKTV